MAVVIMTVATVGAVVLAVKVRNYSVLFYIFLLQIVFNLHVICIFFNLHIFQFVIRMHFFYVSLLYLLLRKALATFIHYSFLSCIFLK